MADRSGPVIEELAIQPATVTRSFVPGATMWMRTELCVALAKWTSLRPAPVTRTR